MINENNDTAVEIQFIDTAGLAIDISGFTECTANLVNRKNGNVLDSFSLTVIAGKKRVYVKDSTTLRCWIEKETWANHVDGALYLEVQGEQPNEEVTGGVQRFGGIIELGKLLNYDS